MSNAQVSNYNGPVFQNSGAKSVHQTFGAIYNGPVYDNHGSGQVQQAVAGTKLQNQQAFGPLDAAQQQMKRCEGSGNRAPTGAAQAVCCAQPPNHVCCSSAAVSATDVDVTAVCPQGKIGLKTTTTAAAIAGAQSPTSTSQAAATPTLSAPQISSAAFAAPASTTQVSTTVAQVVTQAINAAQPSMKTCASINLATVDVTKAVCCGTQTTSVCCTSVAVPPPQVDTSVACPQNFYGVKSGFTPSSQLFLSRRVDKKSTACPLLDMSVIFVVAMVFAITFFARRRTHRRSFLSAVEDDGNSDFPGECME